MGIIKNIKNTHALALVVGDGGRSEKGAKEKSNSEKRFMESGRRVFDFKLASRRGNLISFSPPYIRYVVSLLFKK